MARAKQTARLSGRPQLIAAPPVDNTPRPSYYTAPKIDMFSTLPVDLLRICPIFLSLGDARNLLICSKRFTITDDDEKTNSIFTERYVAMSIIVVLSLRSSRVTQRNVSL